MGYEEILDDDAAQCCLVIGRLHCATKPIFKQTEKTLQQRIKQSSDESAQTRARQSQEISVLRGEELPKLQGKLDQVSHHAQELQGEQEDLKQRSSKLEQRSVQESSSKPRS